jgi:hypothetical protein
MQFKRDAVFTSPVFAEPVVFHGQATAMRVLPQAVMAFAVYPSNPANTAIGPARKSPGRTFFEKNRRT